jgi:hypothetical protein
MSNIRNRLVLASLLLPTAAMALPNRIAADVSPDPSVFNPGSQYTATLDQSHNQWRLQPVNGQDVIINTGSCSTGAMVPTGVWLLVLDAQGRPELLAPSVTRLPAGRSDRVALRACDQAHDRQLAVPQSVLDLLSTNTGAIYVAN